MANQAAFESAGRWERSGPRTAVFASNRFRTKSARTKSQTFIPKAVRWRSTFPSLPTMIP
jgi:hypothetical protein